ncbi:MAG: sulfatase-like hydrolase/transferase, partial [Pseudomonadota bacterium]
TDFTAWDYQRGHESDPWRTRPDPSWMGAPAFGRGHTAYDDSRGYFRGEEDFPGPRTMRAACEWLEREAPGDARFMLFVDEFDPHEPFDTPEPYASMYDSSWTGPHLIWPPYMRGAIEKGVLTPAQARQVRASYGAKLTMIDNWVGKLLAAIERGGFYADTAVIVCTDHGHYLGEKDIWGKPAVPIYEPLGHTPLFIAWPGAQPGALDTLTTNVDISATIADIFGVSMKHRTHGRSILPLLTGE